MDTLSKIKTEMTVLLEQAFTAGRQFENNRITKMFKGEVAPEKPEAPKQKEAKGPKRGYRRTKGDHRRRGRWLCENAIMGMLSEKEIITTADAIRQCKDFSEPTVWSALRSLVKAGIICRRQTGIYEKISVKPS